MRTRIKSIVTAFVLLSLVSGAIGCRSNGGPWYNPKTYAFHNPFGKDEAPLYGSEGTSQANTRPSIGEQPNVNTPPGGYTNKEAEERFLAGRKDTAMVPQYGASQVGADANRIASTTMPSQPSYYSDGTAGNPGYSTYGEGQYGAGAYGSNIVPSTDYQRTTLHSPGGYNPMANTPAAPAADPMVYPGSVAPNSATSAYPGAMATPSPTEGYPPFGAPAQSTAPSVVPPMGAPIYGDPTVANPAANPMGAPMGQDFSSMPATMPTAPASDPMAQPPVAPQGYGQTPPQQNPLGYTYTAAPSAYPPAPQGF